MSATDHEITPAMLSRLARLKNDHPYFARHCLKVADKGGSIVSLELNRAQLFLHGKLEEQRAATGMVRALVVKGRKVGASTYIQGRYFWRLWRTALSLNAFILAHEDKASNTIFGIARRFWEHFPEDHATPGLATDSAKSIVFEDTKCSYSVATAGAKETGRSQTNHLLHGSEVPFWPNADNHLEGAINTVAKVRGTEIILESTGKGMDNMFYRLCMAAMSGNSEYIVIFIPWFWDETLVEECPDDFEPHDDWIELARVHDLTWEQLFWAWNKNRTSAQSIGETVDKPCWKFLQEYPFTIEDAFQSSGNSFIPSVKVMAARRPAEKIVGHGPIILGVDPSRVTDPVGVVDRCGRRMGERVCEAWPPGGTIQAVAGKLARIIDRVRPDMVNIDIGGVGAGVYDLLCDWGYDDICNAVNFGSNPMGRGPTGDEMYLNRRAEMHDEMREWFCGDTPVQVPDRDDLQSEICAAQWGDGATRHNTNGELILEDKDKIKKRLGHSPGLGDAAALTFAVPYSAAMVARKQPAGPRRRNQRTGY